jgi:hypothetical protein
MQHALRPSPIFHNFFVGVSQIVQDRLEEFKHRNIDNLQELIEESNHIDQMLSNIPNYYKQHMMDQNLINEFREQHFLLSLLV